MNTTGQPTECCFCKEPIIGDGNNPDPLVAYWNGRCCDACTADKVVPARFAMIGDVLGGNPMAEGSWVMVRHERTKRRDTEHPALMLKDYDPDANDGHGAATWTDDPDQAMRFPNPMAVLMFWRQKSRVKPIRADGHDNRPLTAYTVVPRNLS